MLNLSPDLMVSGWNTVFVGTLLASAIYVFLLQRGAHPDTKRIMRGFSLVMVGLAIRIGGWIPWRGLLDAGKHDVALWWKTTYSLYWTAGGAVIMIVGMTVLMWPALKRVCHQWALFAVMFGELLLFYLGAWGSYWIAKTFF